MNALVDGIRTHLVELPGLRMHYATAGPADGFPIVLLHGFPEFWYSWRYQIPALAAAGFRVVAPDQRGYNLTDKQPPYTIKTLTQDIVNFADALGLERFHVVGHDWGAPGAWNLAAWLPQGVQRLAAINGPHPNAFADAFRHHPKQWLKSWYFTFFQAPVLPEIFFRANDYAVVERLFAEIPKEHMSQEDLQLYKDAYAQPDAVSAMIGWYRALPKSILLDGALRDTATISCPACVIWGERDFALEKGVNDTLPRYVKHLDLHFVPDAGHWIHMQQPETVNGLLLDFLK
ncbi:MAG: alpha/beta hydrolase [Candidatus Hydrogenedentales bacterium]